MSAPVRTRRALTAAALVAVAALGGAGVALAAPAGPPPASGIDPVRAGLPLFGTAQRPATGDTAPTTVAPRATTTSRPPATSRATSPQTTTPRTTTTPGTTTTTVPPATTPTARPEGIATTPCTATARACVDLASRTAWLLDGDRIVRGPVAMQHGGSEYPTPTGTFTVQWKAEQYTSREFGTPMPYSVFFAPGGVAFHEGRQDTPSAGCVKLVLDDAKAWYSYLQVGDEVQVH
ncbi:L,D-transpeptidase [Pseudonocardia sp. N23]|uniref:L,D-transpeptidase n=1 Tax=Pseudonocardia sp. N23 TaxID=1987376 RepID=UPI000C02FDAE|nr:L,D-transpeptidase [Pseudonocardia sp. N23]GAY10689.1 putative secreted protein [Pseudonocardia sp. N23]